jgi:hypothetical protein
MFFGEFLERLVRQLTKLVQVTYNGELRKAWWEALLLSIPIIHPLFHEEQKREN